MNIQIKKKSPLILSGIFFILLAVITLFLYSKPLQAKPTIQWTPALVGAVVEAGESKAITVTFVPKEDVPGLVDVHVVPELEQFIYTIPKTFNGLIEGKQETIEITFYSGVNEPQGIYDGTIHLRQSTSTLAKPLPAQIRVVWPKLEDSEALGITMVYPPGWHITQEKNDVEFRNVEQPGELSEATLQNESFFRVSLRSNDNSLGLPIDQWFDQSIRPIISENLLLEQNLIIDAHNAIYIEMSEIGGRRAHIYVFRNTDVIEITYGLYTPQFIDDYEVMVQSLNISK